MLFAKVFHVKHGIYAAFAVRIQAENVSRETLHPPANAKCTNFR